jgi:hypothetical protein
VYQSTLCASDASTRHMRPRSLSSSHASTHGRYVGALPLPQHMLLRADLCAALFHPSDAPHAGSDDRSGPRRSCPPSLALAREAEVKRKRRVDICIMRVDGAESKWEERHAKKPHRLSLGLGPKGAFESPAVAATTSLSVFPPHSNSEQNS